MTLGCGAAAGNITSDNVGPQHLINIKRLAYVVRKPEEAFEMPLDINRRRPPRARRPRAGRIDREYRGRGGGTIPGFARIRRAGAAPRPLRRRAVLPVPASRARRWSPTSRPRWWTAFWRGASRRNVRRLQLTDQGAAPPSQPASFRQRRRNRWISSARPTCARPSQEDRKIYIGPKTIVTPSARDLAGPSDILVLAQG